MIHSSPIKFIFKCQHGFLFNELLHQLAELGTRVEMKEKKQAKEIMRWNYREIV